MTEQIQKSIARDVLKSLRKHRRSKKERPNGYSDRKSWEEDLRMLVGVFEYVVDVANTDLDKFEKWCKEYYGSCPFSKTEENKKVLYIKDGDESTATDAPPPEGETGWEEKPIYFNDKLLDFINDDIERRLVAFGKLFFTSDSKNHGN